MERVFEKISKAGLTLKFSKCKFAQNKLNFVGYVLSSDGIEVDPVRAEAVINFPRAKNVAEVQSFLGLCSYDRAFCEGFSSLAQSLTNCLERK